MIPTCRCSWMQRKSKDVPRERFNITVNHRREDVSDAKDAGQKDHNGGDPDVSFGISEDQQLWEIHDR